MVTAQQAVTMTHFPDTSWICWLQRVEELCNDKARLCNRLRSVLKGAELAAFNADVDGMAAHLDTASVAGAAADQKDVPCPAGVPCIDTTIVKAACRTGDDQC